MSKSTDNLKNLLSNGKTRMMVLITTVALLATFGAAYYNMSKKPVQAKRSEVVSQFNAVDYVPGASQNEEYNAAIAKVNEERSAAALSQGGTSLPIIVNNATRAEPDVADPFVVKPQVVTPDPVVEPVKVEPAVEPVPVMVEPQALPSLPPVAIEQPLNPEVVTTTINSISQYMKVWGGNTASSEVSYTPSSMGAITQPLTNTKANTNVDSMSPGSTALSNATAKVKDASFAKAGTVIPGIIITAVDSDEPSPIMAEIVSGPLKGGRLLGALTISGKNSEAMILNFTTLSLPNIDHSFSVNVVAISPKTTRTSMASDVDHHYMQKYGLLFASSFVQGYGQALAQGGATVTAGALGGTTTVYAPATAQVARNQGLASVGTAFAQELASNVSRPNTITIKANEPVGFLFLSDF